MFVFLVFQGILLRVTRPQVPRQLPVQVGSVLSQPLEGFQRCNLKSVLVVIVAVVVVITGRVCRDRPFSKCGPPVVLRLRSTLLHPNWNDSLDGENPTMTTAITNRMGTEGNTSGNVDPTAMTTASKMVNETLDLESELELALALAFGQVSNRTHFINHTLSDGTVNDY